VGDQEQSLNGLAQHYRHFRVAERLLLTGHSHQAWPDVALDGQRDAFDDAALLVDQKWPRAFAKAERLRAGVRELLGEPGGEVALAANTHELVVRFLSALDLKRRPRLVTTDGEFHTLRRQTGRLAEGWLDVVRLPARPVDDLAERLASAADDRTSAVLVSAVLYEDSRIVPGLDALAEACAAHGVELLVDVYHALGAMPYKLSDRGLESAWVVGGGYKYLQLGEGNCFLRVPAHAHEMRPVITGWFSEFARLERRVDPHSVTYPRGAAAFAGSTYDPTSHYRAARVLDFFVEQALTPERLHDSYRHQVALLARAFDALDLPEALITRDRSVPLERFGGFLALQSSQAEPLQRALAASGVMTDSRGDTLRLGPAPYLSDAQLETGIERLGAVLADRPVS
jgi:kynureninase